MASAVNINAGSRPARAVLVGPANHAGPDGSCAFPSVRTLMRYTGLSERTVRACLGRLEAAGLIRPCDPAVAAARIKRADRRPKGWDLDLSLVRCDLAGENVAALECQFPGLAARLAATPGSGDHFHGVQARRPAEVVDNSAAGVQLLHPVPGRGVTSARTGCNLCSRGVRWLHPNHAENLPRNRPPPPDGPVWPNNGSPTQD